MSSREAVLTHAFGRLAGLRRSLFRELRRIPPGEQVGPEGKPHLCCTREQNTMRISSLEARAIVRGLRAWPHLQRELAGVVDRIRAECAELDDTEELQQYTCPLLVGERCLVHRLAKPVGCLAWNPEREFTRAAWRAFEKRDRLNERAIGPDWELKAIPVMLARELELLDPGPGRETPTAGEEPARRPHDDPVPQLQAGSEQQ